MASDDIEKVRPLLDEGQIVALRNLNAKRAGAEVDYICIADARCLTDLGLAERTAQGWLITPGGSAWLSGHGLVGDQ
jgi:hypothetical protein